MLTSLEPRSNPQRGSAPDGLGVADASDGASSRASVGIEQLQRTADLMVESMHFMVEGHLVSYGIGQLPRAVNTLLKGS
jgi:hypothetical protein